MSAPDPMWPALQEKGAALLLGNHVKVRMASLQAVRAVLDAAQPPSEQDSKTLQQLAAIVFETYKHYTDNSSRAEAARVVVAFVRFDGAYERFFVDRIHAIASKWTNIAVSDLNTLLTWTNHILVELASRDAPEHQIPAKALEAQMLLLSSTAWACQNKAHTNNHAHRERLAESIQTQTKTAVAAVFAKLGANAQHALMDFTLATATTVPAQAFCIYLGTVAHAAHELLPTHPAVFQHLQTSQHSDAVMRRFVDHVLLTKTPVMPLALSIFTRFYIRYVVSAETLAASVLPNLEKAILRSSEIGFCHLTAPLFENADAVDMSASFAGSKLLAHVMSGLKSVKENVKESAFESFGLMLRNAVPSISDHDLNKIVDEILKTFKGTTNAESKVLLARSLGLIPHNSEVVCSHLLSAALPLAAKESNEQILAALVGAVAKEYTSVIARDWQVADEPKIVAQFKAGMESAKPALRSIWASQVGSSLLEKHDIAQKKRFAAFFDAVFPPLMRSLAEANKSPLLTISNKGVVPAYVCIALSHLGPGDDDKIFADSLDTSKDKFSILTSPKAISKLSAVEQEWCLRALVRSFQKATNAEQYALALLYFAISANVAHTVRLCALQEITALLSVDGKLASGGLAQAIVAVVSSDEENKLDSEMNLKLQNLAPVLKVLSQCEDKELAVETLVGLFVVFHHQAIPVKENWIGSILRAELNPNNIVVDNLDQLVSLALSTMNSSPTNGPLYMAARACFGSLCLVNADVLLPEVAKHLRADLDISGLAEIDDTAVQIWRAAEGELCVDVLKKNKPKAVEDKNTKDYETRKWEEGLKKELSSKSNKKLTKEEQALVNAQLAEESVIRANVAAVVKTYERAFNVISELSQYDASTAGSPEWVHVSVTYMLTLLKHPNAGDLFGSDGAQAFLQLSRVCQMKNHEQESMVASAILLLHDIQGYPKKYTSEKLTSFISTFLWQFLVDKAEFHKETAYVYLAPFFIKAMQKGIDALSRNSKKQTLKTEYSSNDEEEELLTFVLEILLKDEILQYDFVPREPFLSSMIRLMKFPLQAKKAKECFLKVCRDISVNPTSADLDVLLRNLVTSDTFVKTAILEGIDLELDLSEEMTYSDAIWIAIHDPNEKVAGLATTVWEDNSFVLAEDTPEKLLAYIDEPDSGMRLAVAQSIASAIKLLADKDAAVYAASVDRYTALFHELEVPPPPEKDKFGLVINKNAVARDRWESRSTLALVFKLLSPLCKSQEAVEKIFNFLVVEETLGDKETVVAQELLDAGAEMIKEIGADYVEVLIPIFEKCLAEEDKNSKKQDKIREQVIVLYGTLGRHLAASDARLSIIFERLLQTLDTPSEDVQYTVSECLAPLVKSFEGTLQDHLDKLFEKLWSGDSLAVRKGAAYGIAGLVKGMGIRTLFQNDVMKEVINASDRKKEGVSLILECLSQSLGAKFEPYVIEVLPIILKFLGDSNPHVRDAADYAARQIMKCTTSFGVKKLIPLAISNLDDHAWRSKKGAVELLGSMAYLDPTQLSASLSTIVPEIVGVLNDSHKEVRKAADQSLKRFGEVIRNPEIQAIVPILIKAIGDPTKYTEEALDELIKTQFVHYIDGPSLALIIHVIHRGMRERSATMKKKACQLVGNMAILVDSNDLLSYLPSLVSELEVAMVDPVPETRSTGARALGSLVEKLGEERFPDLIPRLVDTLKDPTRAGDRLGSAQALAEVICGLGLPKLDDMLPSILANAQSIHTHIRAGFIPLLLYLPVCFGREFSPYLSRIIPPILKGLADTDEEIRETSLKAGRLLVTKYASEAVDLLLPELEKGLADSSYRIRLSSVELTGDMLFQITGITGKNELTEEQVSVNKNLVEILGQERRDRVLASLFVCRSDVANMVRTAAIDIWKALVANTPRTVKEIIPSLTQILVTRLASSDEVQRAIAASTLGDVVRRVGVNALSQLLPTLEELLVSSDAGAKQGICIAITELINSASAQALHDFQETFIRIIRNALSDPSSVVRAAAANAFDALQEQLGNVVIDEILPYLLNRLESADSENALSALQDIMATKSGVIFPILIPTLMAPPIDVFKAKALSSLASVVGSTLYSRLASIINTLLQAVIDTKKTGTPEDVAEVEDAFDKLLLSIDSDEGVHPVMQQLMSLVKHQDPERRAAIGPRLAVFFEKTHLDYSIYVQDMVSQLIFYLGDRDADVVAGVFSALFALVKAQDKPVLESLVKPAHQALTLAGQKGEELPGLALPRGPSCLLPIFSNGLMYGSSEQKELSALSIADLIDRTPASNLKPFATPLTGPLIRVIGEKVSSDIKSAILSALTSLLRKIPQFLRPFIPQLQRTFVRSLSDPSNEKLRNGAVDALGLLIEFQPRVDSLVTELVTGAKNTEDQGVKNSLLKAMLQVVLKGGKNMSEASKASIMSLVEEELNTVDDKSAVAYARLLGSLSQILSTDEASNILRTKILNRSADEAELKFAILSINSFLRDAPVHVFKTGLLDEIIHYVINCCKSTSPYISDNATVAIGKLMLLDGETKSPKQDSAAATSEPFEIPETSRAALVEQIATSAIQAESSSSDTRRLALAVLRTVARLKYQEFIAPHLTVIATSVFSCLRDPVIPIRLAAEKAYLAVFNMVADVEQKAFTSWFAEASKDTITTVTGAVIQPRSIGDYSKRVASRLATVERERLEAGGDDDTMFSDRIEDENEVWAVGGF